MMIKNSHIRKKRQGTALSHISYPLSLRFCPLSLLLLTFVSCGPKQPVSKAKTIPAPQAMAPTIHPPTPAPAKTPSAAPKTAPERDTVALQISRADGEYQRGEANYNSGHLEAAKLNFDNAVNMLLSGPISPKSDPRLMQEFEKIVQQVNRLEMAALQQGDGFSEQNSVPAPIIELNEMTFPVDPNVKAAAQAELAVTTSDLPLVINDYVAGFLSFFSTPKGHSTIERALVRAGKYRPMVERILREEGVPQDIIYLAQAESGFQPTALNPSGARGMWQLMPARGGEYGLRHTWWIDEREDPEKSTRAAARHLHDLYKQFGDWYLAMAAYDSGPGNVQYAVEKTGYADFWELYRRNVLPGETKNYVPIIIAMTIAAKNPQQYGLSDIVPELPLEIESVKVDYPVDLRLVAECADVTLQKLQDLNPSLLRLTTPKDTSFDLHLPVGSKDRYLAAISLIPVDKRVSWRYHPLEPGDTLGTLARKYHTSSRAIAEANNLDNEDAPLRQAKLIIPITASRAVADGSFNFSKTPTHYSVRRGDTVLSIADRFGVPAERVRHWNNLHGNSVKAGRRLAIFLPRTELEGTAPRARKRSRKSPARGTTKSSARQVANSKAKKRVHSAAQADR
ncbi:MAG: transglycosylase SLT domain-containing protein [Acidobacteriaceae bacterium]